MRDWKDFKSEIKRDFKSHGVLFKFTSGTIKLGFADGRDILEGAFQLEGFDAVVTLMVEQKEEEFDTFQEIFTGNAIMKNRELEENYFNVDFESSTFQQKVINRLKTKVKIDTLLDLDGNALSGSITEQVNDWNTIRLDRVFFAENPLIGLGNGVEDTNEASPSFGNGQFSFFYFGDVKIDSLQNIPEKSTKVIVNSAAQPDGVGSFSGAVATPTLWTATKAGSVNISGHLNFTLELLTSWTSGTDDLTSEYDVLIHHVSSSITDTVLCSDTATELSVSTPHTETFTNKQCAFDEDFDVEIGDAFYLVIKTQSILDVGTTRTLTTTSEFKGVIGGGGGMSPRSFINITQLQAQEIVEVKSWLIHDVINRLMYIISGQNNLLTSDFFGNTENGYSEDGCGALNVITNGYQLRTLTDNELNISLDDVLTSMQAIYGIGYGFEKQYDGTYKLRVELLEYFYNDTEIMDLGSPVSIKEKGSYVETSNEDLILNKVEIGYTKFNQDIGVNNIFEDFLTESNYSLPLETVEGTYTQKSRLIASNDIIQATYDQRFVLTESWKYDEDNFIIKVVRSGSDIVPENDEFFESVGGLDDSGSAYNIRFAPVFMFGNHALIVNSSLFGKSLSRLIQNTTTTINFNFNATFNSYETCLLGDVQRLQRSSVGNIEIGNNYAGLRLFNPINHTLTVALSKAQFTTLTDAMEGGNLGYLTYRDNDGNTKQGYLMDAKWGEVEGEVDIDTLERADNYAV